jgi:hypothetical protein
VTVSEPGAAPAGPAGVGWSAPGAPLGVDPVELTDEDLLRELERVHDTRHETFRHGSEDALATHSRRTAELEAEYLRRWPRREVDPDRLRVGARRRQVPSA